MSLSGLGCPSDKCSSRSCRSARSVDVDVVHVGNDLEVGFCFVVLGDVCLRCFKKSEGADNSDCSCVGSLMLRCPIGEPTRTEFTILDLTDGATVAELLSMSV